MKFTILKMVHHEIYGIENGPNEFTILKMVHHELHDNENGPT